MSAVPAEVAPGLWRWTTTHPEWHPQGFGAQVGCYALQAGDDLLLVDALLPGQEPEPTLAVLDELAAGREVAVLVTLGYHVRSAGRLAERFDAPILGPATCASRLPDPSRLTALAPGDTGPGGMVALRVGSPPRSERPLWLPSHGAIAFGDAVVTTPEGDLRMWCQDPMDARRRRFYRERFAPTLAAMLEHPVERVLVTHGEPVLVDGAARLREAVEADPWDHDG